MTRHTRLHLDDVPELSSRWDNYRHKPAPPPREDVEAIQALKRPRRPPRRQQRDSDPTDE